MDRVYFSAWLRGFTQNNMFGSFEKVLRMLPFSRLRPEALLTVHAVSYAEPVLTERRFEQDTDTIDIIEVCREFDNADCAYQLETYWDLMSKDEAGEWKLQPVPISITCYAPLFESDLGEQILIDFGPDSRFLPEGGGMLAAQSNIRSLLHLTADIAKNLPIGKKTLWSESGENLAERLVLAAQDPR
jgi:hypothetical protein